MDFLKDRERFSSEKRSHFPPGCFERVGTIGEGAECCDFHFIKG